MNLHKPGKVSDAVVENDTVNTAKDSLRKMIINCNFNINEVIELLQNNNWDQERMKYFICSMKEKKTDILYSMMIHHNSSHADTVINFDWFLKLVLGSSECKDLRYPLLQVVLDSINSSGCQKQRLYEMNKESLSKLINILEDYQGSAGE